MRSGVRIALGAAVLVVLLAVLAVLAERTQRSGRATAAGSSFRADETGHRAARLLLESLGFTVHSRRGVRLPDGTGHVLVRVEGLPGTSPGDAPDREREAEGAALARWVEHGNGVLLLASRAPPGSGLPRVRERVALPVDGLLAGPPATGAPAAPEVLDALFGRRPDVPSDGIDRREEISLPGVHDPAITSFYVVAAGEDDVVLAAQPDGDGSALPVVVESPRGRGRVIVVADPWFATNVGIARGDNAAWVAALVERLARGGDVWIDDRAVGQPASRGVLSLLQEAGLGPALAAGFLLLLVVWWRVAPCDAPRRLAGPREAYRPETYAELRAHLYASCLSPGDVRRVVRGEAARRLGRGDGASYDRVLSMLAVRDPARAERLKEAVAALPRHRNIGVAKHAASWSAAVTRVWSVLEERPRGVRGDERGTDREEV